MTPDLIEAIDNYARLNHETEGARLRIQFLVGQIEGNSGVDADELIRERDEARSQLSEALQGISMLEARIDAIALAKGVVEPQEEDDEPEEEDDEDEEEEEDEAPALPAAPPRAAQRPNRRRRKS